MDVQIGSGPNPFPTGSSPPSREGWGLHESVPPAGRSLFTRRGGPRNPSPPWCPVPLHDEEVGWPEIRPSPVPLHDEEVGWPEIRPHLGGRSLFTTKRWDGPKSVPPRRNWRKSASVAVVLVTRGCTEEASQAHLTVSEPGNAPCNVFRLSLNLAIPFSQTRQGCCAHIPAPSLLSMCLASELLLRSVRLDSDPWRCSRVLKTVIYCDFGIDFESWKTPDIAPKKYLLR